MTKLGLLSDSHGRAATTSRAVDLLLQNGADVLIHLGDIETASVIDALAVPCPDTGKQAESHLVFGNCDWDQRALAEYARDLGIRVHHPAGRIVIDDKLIGFTHGHLPAAMDELVAEEAAYLLHGHTHVLSDTTQGATRVINPGALHRAKQYTVAALTPATGEIEFIGVPSELQRG